MPDTTLSQVMHTSTEPELICHDCGYEIGSSETIFYHTSGEPICYACYEENYWICNSCCNLFHNDEDGSPTVVDGEVYCNQCRDYHYRLCGNCSRYRYIEEMYNRSMCRECHEELHGTIHSWDYQPRSFSFFSSNKKNKKEELYLGVELEVAYNENCNNDLFLSTIRDYRQFMYAKHDGSIDPNYNFNGGAEIVTHPATIDHIKEQGYWEVILQRLRNHGCSSYDTGTCGIHVHLSRRSFSKFHLLKFISFFYQNKRFIRAFSKRNDSEFNRWCGFKSTPVEKVKFGDGDKYHAVNLCHLHSIEVRIFRGTLNYNSFMANIEFCHACFHWTKQESFKNLNANNFIRFVKKNRKTYKHLTKKLNSKEFSNVLNNL